MTPLTENQKFSIHFWHMAEQLEAHIASIRECPNAAMREVLTRDCQRWIRNRVQPRAQGVAYAQLSSALRKRWW